MNGQPEHKDETQPEADVFTLLFFFLKRWKIIVAAGFGFAVIGVVYALLSKPVYESSAVISSRDNSAGGGGASAFISQLGGLGGAVASQYGLMNSNLDKIQILVTGRDLSMKVIQKNNLLPRLYPKQWDARNRRWKQSAPNLRKAAEDLRKVSITATIDAKKKVLTFGAYAGDSVLARDLVVYYLEALNTKIQDDTRRDAESNREYLEIQLGATQDPLLRDRIQALMASEIERYMLISVRAFDVLEEPAVPIQRLKPQRSKIVIGFGFAGGVLACGLLLLLQALKNRKIRFNNSNVREVEE